MDRPEFEIVVPHAAWRSALLPLLADPQRWASGLLRRERRGPHAMLHAEEWAAAPRTGDDYPPLADWMVVAAPGGEPPERPDEWFARLKPSRGQLLAVLLTGFGAQRAGWRGWTVERGVVRPLAGFRIVGAGMVHAEHQPEHEPTPARWSRTVGPVGEGAFRKLRHNAVAVIGCSRTGNLAAGMLAALGVRRVALIDPDCLEEHNLDAMLLATEADIGRSKSVAVGERLVAFRRDLAVTSVAARLATRAGMAAAEDVDLLVTCVDADGPRLRCAHLARRRMIPHLDIGVGVRITPLGKEIAADVRLMFGGGGCVRCCGGLANLEDAEFELRAPLGALPRRLPEPWNARGRIGSLITASAAAVATGIQSYLDALSGELRHGIWHRMLWRPATGWETRSAPASAAPDCPICFGKESKMPK